MFIVAAAPDLIRFQGASHRCCRLHRVLGQTRLVNVAAALVNRRLEVDAYHLVPRALRSLLLQSLLFLGLNPVELLVARRRQLALLERGLRALLLFFLAPVRVLRHDLGLEAAALDLEVLPEDLGLDDEAILVLDLFDSARVDAARGVEALADRVAMLLELLEHVLLLARRLLNHLLLSLPSQLVLEQRLRVQPLVHPLLCALARLLAPLLPLLDHDY